MICKVYDLIIGLLMGHSAGRISGSVEIGTEKVRDIWSLAIASTKKSEPAALDAFATECFRNLLHG